MYFIIKIIMRIRIIFTIITIIDMMVHMLAEVVGLGRIGSLLLTWLVVLVQIAVVGVSRLLYLDNLYLPVVVSKLSSGWTALTFGLMIVHSMNVDNKSKRVVHRKCIK